MILLFTILLSSLGGVENFAFHPSALPSNPARGTNNICGLRASIFKDWRKSLAKNQAFDVVQDITDASSTRPKRPVSKYGEIFDQMLRRFALLSEGEVASIADVELRTLVQGVKKVISSPQFCFPEMAVEESFAIGRQGMQVAEVEEAFRILYEDFLPVRIGGDAIFNSLSSRLNKQIQVTGRLSFNPSPLTKHAPKLTHSHVVPG